MTRPLPALLILQVLLCAPSASAQVAQQPWTQGAAVDVLWHGEWYPADIVRANHGWYKIHYVGYADSSDEFVDGGRVRARQAEPPKGPWSAGDAVEVSWHGTWYQAKVIEVNHGWYRIHYVGYDASSDEIVDDSRVRPVSRRAAVRAAGGPVEQRTYAPPPAAPGPSGP